MHLSAGVMAHLACFIVHTETSAGQNYLNLFFFLIKMLHISPKWANNRRYNTGSCNIYFLIQLNNPPLNTSTAKDGFFFSVKAAYAKHRPFEWLYIQKKSIR